ncbi:MAG: tRNA-dihydrouridine synthase [Candidatus Saccharibacteria bacterium]|nr:tRNA-dihydrouridine synthase [Candidatus Saccharibacteria bacterium]
MTHQQPLFILAPMDEVTDTVFRQIIASTAKPDLFFTEFVNVDGLNSPGREKLLPKLRFTASEQPLIAQVWGKKPENFYLFCQQVADGSLAKELGLPAGVNFAGVDLNMGCPAKSEVQNGTCAALIKPENRELALAIIRASREGLAASPTPLPLSVKTRLGFSDVDFTWHKALLSEKLNMLTIHGRTRKQMSKVPADWSLIGEVVKLRDSLSPATKIVGNGDVMSKDQGRQLAEQYGLDGIMIGRGIFSDPFVFADASPWEAMTRQERIALYTRHVQLYQQTWGDSYRPVRVLNKFCKVYINGFDGAKELREQLMAATSTAQLLSLLDQTKQSA